jgi:hypothetical protein
VSKGEVDIVNHFLNTVCPPDVLDKLELRNYFDQKLRNREVQICQEDSIIANFLIAQTCVEVLVIGDDSRLSSLREYAVLHLAHHMFNTKRDMVNPDSLAAFGSDLAKLFNDEGAIDNLLWAATRTPTVPDLLRNDKFVTEVFSWMNDPVVASKTDPDESKHWWKVDDSPNKSKVLIEPLIHRMMVHCFRTDSRSYITVDAFKAIRSYCHQVSLLEGLCRLN